MTDRQAAYQLLGILQHYAPNQEAQEVCANYYRKAQEFNKDKQLVRVMTGALWDGLSYGNWPWTLLGGDK